MFPWIDSRGEIRLCNVGDSCSEKTIHHNTILESFKIVRIQNRGVACLLFQIRQCGIILQMLDAVFNLRYILHGEPLMFKCLERHVGWLTYIIHQRIGRNTKLIEQQPAGLNYGNRGIDIRLALFHLNRAVREERNAIDAREIICVITSPDVIRHRNQIRLAVDIAV